MWARSRSAADLQAPMEFFQQDGGGVKQQLSPTKGVMDAGQRAMLQLAARTGKAVPATAGAASPVAVAAPAYTASQPSSATSSLAATLADLQVSSRQSSASDLGDRSRILAGLPPGLAAVHTRRASVGSDDPATPSSPADSVCSPQLVGAIRSFDTVVLRTLTPIKTRSRAGTEHGGGSDSSELPPSPPAPFADRLVSPFHEGHPGLKPKMAPGRPVVYHTRGASSGGLPAAPGAYNPYDLTMAALSSEFRSPAQSLAGSSSRATSTTATPSQWGSSGTRASSYRALVAAQALAATKDDEPDYYVSVPGMVRRQHSSLASAATPGSAATAGSATAAAAAAQQHQAGGSSGGSGGSLGTSSLCRSGGSQGSGSLAMHCSVSSTSGTLSSFHLTSGHTAVHGFRGLFKSLVVMPAPGGASPAQR